MVTSPDGLAVRGGGYGTVTHTPFFLYFTGEYPEPETRPVSVIFPSLPPQVVVFVGIAEPIDGGSGPLITKGPTGNEKQLFNVIATVILS
jgi:hypothetical protein